MNIANITLLYLFFKKLNKKPVFEPKMFKFFIDFNYYLIIKIFKGLIFL